MVQVGVAEPLARSSGGSPEMRWIGVSLFIFRCSCVYFLLEWLPLILMLQTRALTWGLLNAPDWWDTVNRAAGRWAIAHVLGLPEHSPPRFSANDLQVLVGMVGLGVISVCTAMAWSALDRRRVGYPRLFDRMHTFMRFMVGAIMLLYGWHKILPAQFDLTLYYLALPVGQHTPRDLLWAFMGASRSYQVFAGSVEVIAGLLLFARRTAMLGALMSMAAMANVLALDIAYDAPVKFLAGQLFLTTLFLLAPFAKRLADVFVLSPDKDAGPVRFVQRLATRRRSRVGIALLVAWIVCSNLLAARKQVNVNERYRQTPLYGIWELEGVARNGASIPPPVTDTTLWRRLVVHSTNAAVIIPVSEPANRAPHAGRYTVQLDTTTRSVRLTPFSFSGTTQPLEFQYRLPDRDHLVLEPHTDDGSTALRLRRLDPSIYTLPNWERSWSW